MRRKIVSDTMVILFAINFLILAWEIQIVRTEPTTIYVDDDNTTGPWDGTPAYPYQNITSGLEHAVANDMVFVLNGTYYESVEVSKSVSLYGESKFNTTVDGGSGNNCFWIRASNVNISGFSTHNCVSSAFLIDSSNNNISGNIVSSGHDYPTFDTCGIHDRGGNNMIADNTITLNGEVGMVIWSNNNQILRNIVTNNGRWGIILDYNSSTLDSNVIHSNTYFGIAMSGYGHTLVNNTISNQQCNFKLGHPLHDPISVAGYNTHSIDATNTVDGKPIYYVVGDSDKVYDSQTNAGVFYLIDSNNITIKNLEFTKNHYGLLVWNSTNAKIENITAYNNWYSGIEIQYSNDTIVHRCNISDNAKASESAPFNYEAAGIFISASSDVTIDSNLILDNLYGIVVFWTPSVNNIISNNYISESIDGIVLKLTSKNTIYGNTIFSSSQYGLFIWVWMLNNNTIYHNNFINNTIQAGVLVEPSLNLTNFWDDGYALGGNYWSNYNGTDLHYGPYQNKTGSDGIGDTPYIIEANNTDYYPLMKEWGEPYYDVTGDKYVGIDDIVVVAEHFGLAREHPDWNPKYDVTGDAYVGIDDIVAVAEHFGMTYP